MLSWRYLKFIAFISLLNINAVYANTYVFVSFSMNDSAIKAYYDEAKKYDARLIMRGLYQDSFILTKEKSESLGVSFDIDPVKFDKYQVTAVPTIVKDSDKVQKVVGHIPLKTALDLFVDS